MLLSKHSIQTILVKWTWILNCYNDWVLAKNEHSFRWALWTVPPLHPALRFMFKAQIVWYSTVWLFTILRLFNFYSLMIWKHIWSEIFHIDCLYKQWISCIKSSWNSKLTYILLQIHTLHCHKYVQTSDLTDFVKLIQINKHKHFFFKCLD